MPLPPLGLAYSENNTCLTILHLILPEIGLNDLRKSAGLCRWNGILYLPKVPISQMQKGDIALFRYYDQPQHVGIILSKDGGSLFEMLEITCISYRNYIRLSYYDCWEFYRPSRILVG